MKLVVLLFLLLGIKSYAWSLSPVGCFKRLEAGEYYSTVAYGNRLLKAGYRDYATYMCLGQAHLKLDNYRMSIRYLERASLLASNDAEKLLSGYYLAKAYELGGDLDRAIKLYRNTLGFVKNFKDGISFTLLFDLARVYYKAGQRQEALKVYSDIFYQSDSDSDRLIASERMADIMIEMGRYENAQKTLDIALSNALSAGDVLALSRINAKLGDLGMRQKKVDMAINHYKEAIKHARSAGQIRVEAGLYERLAKAYLMEGQISESLDAYQKGIALYRRLGSTRDALRLQSEVEIINNLLELRRPL